MNRDKLTYRQSTSAVVINKLGQILIVQKKCYKGDEWDIPGGGVKTGELPELAIFRELNEELGSNKFEMIKESKNVNRYEWPDDLINQKIIENKPVFRGEERKQFLIKYFGETSEIKPQEEEIREVKWVFPDELPAYFVFPHQMEKMKVLLKEFGIE